MPHFFEKRDPWGHGLGLWVLVCMAFTLPLAVWGVSRLRMENDVEHWLSDDNIQTRQFDWYNQHFAAEDSLLLSWNGSAIEDPRVEQLARRLVGTADADGVRRGGLKQVESVRTPGQLIRRMVDLKIDRDEALRRITGVLAGPGPVWCQFSTAALNQRVRSLRLLQTEAAKQFGLQLEIADRFGGTGEEEEEVEYEASDEESESTTTAASDNTAENSTEEPETSAEEVIEEIASHDFQVSWHNMHSDPKVVTDFIAWARGIRIPVAGQRDGEPLLTDCFVHPGQPAAIAVVLSEAGKADRSGTLERIRQLAEEVGVPRSTLHLGGSPVAAATLNEEVLKAIWNPAAPWYLPHRRSVVIFSWLVGLGLAFWLLRSVRLALIVLTVSYFSTLITVALVPAFGGTMNMVLIVMPTLLLVVTMSGAVHLANYWKNEANRDPRTAIVQSILTARIPCVMASITTAIGLGSLLTSHLAPVRDFGFYSAIGTLISVVGVLYGVPALLQAWPAPPPAVTTVTRRPWTRLGRMIVRHSTAVTILWVLVSAATLYGLSKFRTETKAIRYFPDDSRLVQDYNYLEERLAGIVPVETVITFGRQAREELNFTQRLEIVRSIEQKMRLLPDISGTISLADFQPVSEPVLETASLKEKLAYNTRAKAVEARVRKDAQARTFFLVPKQDSEFNHAGDELWRITSQVDIMSRLDYQQLTQELDVICRSVTKYHPDTRHVVTGMVPLFLATQQAIIDSLINSFMLAFALIGVVMIIIARDVTAGLLSMIPNVLPIGVVFGSISWYGIPVDVGTLITASVALGIAVDGTLHLLTWYRDGLIAGISRRRAIVRSLEQCGPALWQTSAAVGLAMLVLSPAPLLLISRFGWLMCSLIITAMLADIVLTPAMLAGPMGWLIFRAVQKQRNRLKAVTEDPNPDDGLRHRPHVMPAKPQIAAESRPDTASQFGSTDARQRKRRR